MISVRTIRVLGLQKLKRSEVSMCKKEGETRTL